MEGWFKTHRKLMDSPEWLAEPFTRGQAWVDLIALTNHKPGYIRVAGERIDIARGQCGWSEVKLSERWKWSRNKTRRYINELLRDSKVSLKRHTRTTIITICNYNEYQSGDTADDTAESTTERHQTIQQKDTNKNVKNEKKEGESRTHAYTCEAPPSPPVEYKIVNKESETPKISRSLIVNLLKRQERGEKLSDEDQEILKNDRKSQGFQEPKKPPEDPYAVAKSLIWQRDKLGRGHLFTASQIAEIAKYESLHNNNHLNGARVG